MLTDASVSASLPGRTTRSAAFQAQINFALEPADPALSSQEDKGAILHARSLAQEKYIASFPCNYMQSAYMPERN